MSNGPMKRAWIVSLVVAGVAGAAGTGIGGNGYASSSAAQPGANGAASFGAGSTYAVEVNAAGQSDRLAATGAISILLALLLLVSDRARREVGG